MRGFLIAIFLLLSGFAMASGALVFDKEIHDFGTIKEVDGKVSCVFTYKNTSNKPVIIENIAVSCGCTTPVYSREPIMPEQSKPLKITFDPEARPGDFLKEIYILSNNGSDRANLKIKGSVTPRPRTREDDFPMELASGIRITALNLNFMNIARAKASSMAVGVMNFSDKVAQIRFETKSDYLKISKPLTLKPRQNGEITVSYDLPLDVAYGMNTGVVEIYINGLKQAFDIGTSAVFVDDFSSVDFNSAPKADFSSQFLSFGTFKKNTQAEREITLTNEGKSDLIIRDISTSDLVDLNLKVGDKILPGEDVKVNITLKTSELGRIKESVVVVFNDPRRPMRELRIFATVE